MPEPYDCTFSELTPRAKCKAIGQMVVTLWLVLWPLCVTMANLWWLGG